MVPYEIMAESVMCQDVSLPDMTPLRAVPIFTQPLCYFQQNIYLHSPNSKWCLEILFLYTHGFFATTVEVTLLTVILDGRIGQLFVPTILLLEKELVALLR